MPWPDVSFRTFDPNTRPLGRQPFPVGSETRKGQIRESTGRVSLKHSRRAPRRETCFPLSCDSWLAINTLPSVNHDLFVSRHIAMNAEFVRELAKHVETDVVDVYESMRRRGVGTDLGSGSEFITRR